MVPRTSPDADAIDELPATERSLADGRVGVVTERFAGRLAVGFAVVTAVWSVHGLLYAQHDPLTDELVVRSLIAPLLGVLVTVVALMCGVALLADAHSRANR